MRQRHSGNVIRTALTVAVAAGTASALGGCALGGEQEGTTPGIYGFSAPESVTRDNVDTAHLVGENIGFVRGNILKLDIEDIPREDALAIKCGRLVYQATDEYGNRSTVTAEGGKPSLWNEREEDGTTSVSCNYVSDDIKLDPAGAIEQLNRLLPEDSVNIAIAD